MNREDPTTAAQRLQAAYNAERHAQQDLMEARRHTQALIAELRRD